MPTLNWIGKGKVVNHHWNCYFQENRCCFSNINNIIENDFINKSCIFAMRIGYRCFINL